MDREATIDTITNSAAERNLSVLGYAPVIANDFLPGSESLILLGPLEPGFWDQFTDTPEFRDTRPDPMDRWSERVIADLAAEWGGKALFPFGGPPYRPFFDWALRSNRAWQSPTGMLVHDVAGLMVSFRGAIAIGDTLPSAPASPSPCEQCAEKPCLATCPVGALKLHSYDTKRCHYHLDTRDGKAGCMAVGCRARLSCPISRDYPRQKQQSAFHMKAFHP